MHRWVTDQMVQPFKLSGTITLEFYSRTLGEASYPGTVCAFLFKRSETGSGETTKANDVLFQNAENSKLFWTYSQGSGSWPRTAWTKLRLTMKIAGTQEIGPKERLGLALGVDAGTTPAEGLQVMYDHPDYASRLEVDTTTPIEAG
jgi:hypothetical protein